MTFDQRLEHHFSTPVLIQTHEGLEALNQSLLHQIEALKAASKNAADDPLNTTQGGFQSSPDVSYLDTDHPSITSLRGEIIWPAIETYMIEALQVDPLFTPLTLSSWVVCLESGDWQAPHIHPTEYGVISGIYYVEVPGLPEPQGCLEFINPNLNAMMLGNQDASRRHRPTAGQVILFPPYYMHYVHPLKEEAKRTVVAFDVKLTANR